MNGFGRIMKENFKHYKEGLFDNVNILTTNARPKKAKDIKSYDTKNSEIAMKVNFDELLKA